MARSLEAFKRNLLKGLESVGEFSKRAIYYGFIPGLLYLGITTEPRPNLRALLGI